MSSRRFPGKVLAPLFGKPLIRHVYDKALEAGICGASDVVIVTSYHASDNPIELYCREHLLQLHRGPLDDVLGRFAAACTARGGQWIVRLTADSPFVSVELLKFLPAVLEGSPFHLVTTTYRRTLPKGTNLEAIHTEALLDMASADDLTDADKEHVTAYFHRHPERFRICNIGFRASDYSDLDYAVDEPADLARLESSGYKSRVTIPWPNLEAWEVSD
jgi:spore coat polysaccharide biosynthesis protein SpsF